MAKILLVDDDELFRGMVHKTLDRAGFEVVDACNGEEALKRFRAGGFDLVITDMVMPEQEGIETVMELLGMSPSLKIIAISGGGRGKSTDYLVMAKKLGVVKTLAKPFENEELVVAVNEVLSGAVGV